VLLYHFTAEFHLQSILREGVLRTTDPNLFSEGPMTVQNKETGAITTIGEILGQPVVWLLDTPTVEFDHGLGDGTRGLEKRTIRVTIEVADASPWLRWLTARTYDAAHVARIVRSGGGKAAARHWYVVPRPIPRGEWTEVKDMRTGTLILEPTP
jgi:hypothetical protein